MNLEAMEKGAKALSTLRKYKKDELIEEIRILEHNLTVKEEFYTNATNKACKLLRNIEKYKWHDLRKDPNDLPNELETVNIAWTNHRPARYYSDIKNKIFSDASAVYYGGKWWWWSNLCVDMLTEYGQSVSDGMARGIEVIAWKYIEPLEENNND